MLTLTKFVCGCFGIGAAALLGVALIEAPGPHAQGSVANSGDAVIQSAAAEAGTIYRQVSMEVGPKVHYFAISSGAFVRGNLLTARLQFEGMRNTIAADLSIDAWRTAPAPGWMQNGVQGARQASTQRTLAMAGSMPQVTVVRSELQRFADAHPSLAGSGF
jgi:hypothetical protein